MEHDPKSCTCPCHVQCTHHSSNASSRQQTPEAPCTQAMVLIRFAEHKIQRYLNAITSVKSIMKVYGGKSFGVVDHLKRCDSTGWIDGYLIGISVFGDVRGAKDWYRSDVFCNQHDWLDDTDIIVVQLRQPVVEYPDKRSVFMMGNYIIKDEICFQSEFMDKVNPIFKGSGGNVLADTTPERLHGNWKAGRFYLVQFPNEASLHQLENNDEVMAADEVLKKTSCACTVILMTDTNMPGTPSHRKPSYL
ncbi:uncharacterized protein LOC135495161 [Lineus longissimus]|uniref:uncharacterized protein LOC135495161 n=1 Tax=Lineus longissimus TaxID=88925 RepID=UPI002B4EF9F2